MKSLAAIIATVVLLHLAFAKENPSPPLHAPQRLREGTRLLEVAGQFEAVGDRVNFVFAESGESVRVLENLALERISRVLTESQGSPQWTISGTITEYNGGNFLLLAKAIQTGKTAPQESPKASGVGTRAKVDYSGSQGKESRPKNQDPSHDQRP